MNERPVAVVLGDGPVPLDHALDWAIAEADRRAVAVRVLGRTEVELARAARRVRAAGLPVTTRAVPREAVWRSSADASVLVLPSPADEFAVATALCPVAVVPDCAAAGDAVYVGVAPWTATTVLDAAAEEASERGVELVAVRAWTDRRVDLGVVSRRMLHAWDEAADRAGRDLDAALSAYRVAYPHLLLRSLVVQDDPTDLLETLSVEAGLLVVGRSERGLLARALAGSPVAALLRAAACPLLVVPEDGPQRRTLLPSPATRLARLTP
ncbi:universal stress protein [Pseudonocardia xishanensis]|uniref:UspA domain-containing protein n=1 Tax=Pseudonocardia xishanensis TaxID=630995 RepID=A0ABP8RLZ0_9PSEU